MQRREFIMLLGGAAAVWPLAARAQQSALPVVGYISAASAQSYAQQRQLSAFLKGLTEAGYVDGRDVTIEYRWAEDRIDRLPAMVADLIHRQVAVIATTTTPAALAAKVATTTIPIVFELGGDPVQLALVPSLNRPGSNVTGVTHTNQQLAPKRLQLLQELVPTASVMALLVSPAYPTVAETNTKEVQAAARTLGLELHVLNAGTERDFDGVFTKLIQLRAGGLVIGGGAFLISSSEQLAALTVRHAVPAIFFGREFAVAGGLLSYGADIPDAYRLAGIYTGRVLKGEKPADLPVQQATKVELIINLKTAKALAITVPNTLIGRADEVIE
ncbi:MAG: ABC transporter substrate-binding protein [Pseudolabrys sp.]|jgi:putative ABC transport system substrate-binding protein